ncbi:unnamed protein product [Angiostrongylus costaricensis]|uniref:Uncharacterized protein n=1 Tax=Angiostrongylus costaricensis TaxID=334426 RepID=A0A0R3Q1Q9_ANGCS|nr:unnamed protein product [Angiostrongylus costaricensis]
MRMLLFSLVALSVQQQWEPSRYPNPRKGGFKQCNMRSVSNVCDPDEVLGIQNENILTRRTIPAFLLRHRLRHTVVSSITKFANQAFYLTLPVKLTPNLLEIEYHFCLANQPFSCDIVKVLNEADRYRLNNELQRISARTESGSSSYCGRKGVDAVMAIVRQVGTSIKRMPP